MLSQSYVIQEALQTEMGIEVTESILKCTNMPPSLTELTESAQVVQVNQTNSSEVWNMNYLLCIHSLFLCYIDRTQ